jgi:hypothetical protein
MKYKLLSISFLALLFSISCNNSQSNKNETMNTKDSLAVNTTSNIKLDSVNMMVNGKNYIGSVAYDENVKEKRPAIFLIPERWG